MTRKIAIPYNILMAIGLFSLCGINLINFLTPLPDFLHGFFVGLGFVLVVAGFTGFVKQRRKPSA